ncbi:isocitrate lyase [Lujinxingia vulgaris]|uniref:Isocitrate lyase n=1 Tax=Lujinxingia vulgaris TaxID=2600176 RepID=A0A5C6X845_9DELT|nr:isocitrate lyase [Lujinxingia vulgaris]TXD34923.1 isocitrate lyase [Lujinxingia vulgaris]
MSQAQSSEALQAQWDKDPRWRGVQRPYPASQVFKLRGSVPITYTLAERGAVRLWELFHDRPFVRCLSAVTGNQAIQQVQAGLEAIYISGWQVAGDANSARGVYPDQSLYPVDSVPKLVDRVNRALQRADQVAHIEGTPKRDWFAPIVADAEAGFGGNLNAFELMKAMIEAGASGVHFEDQLSSAKKCGHMGGKVLVPTSEFIQKLVAARLASDVMGVPTVLVARTDAHSAKLLTSDIDPMDRPFIKAESGRSAEGFYTIRGGLEFAIERAMAYAPYADMLWCETSTPDLGEAEEFAKEVRSKYPDKLLAYNCSPSFNWRQNLDDRTIARFQEKLGEMGYALQFVTLSGWHSLNAAMFELALDYRERGMAAYSQLQEHEFELARQQNYSAVRHQAFVGAGYFDEVQLTITGGESQTVAMRGSTEEDQF